MTTTSELWRPVVGHEHKYQVSDLGRVRSIDFWDGRRNVKGKVLSVIDTRSGHVNVSIGANNKQLVHRLVLAAFIGPPPEGCEVLHLNHVPWDNRLSNLKYGTRSENLDMDYAINGRSLYRQCGTDRHNTIFSEEDIRHIRTCVVPTQELGRVYGVNRSTIRRIRARESWRHVV